MIKKLSFFTSMVITMWCLSGLTFADDKLHVTHSIIASQQDGFNHMVSFQITINNLGEDELNRVKLSTANNEFSNLDEEKLINIGHLPSMGQAIIEWTINTPVDVSYFESGMPLFFVIEAKHNNGQIFEIPVYSSGSTAL